MQFLNNEQKHTPASRIDTEPNRTRPNKIRTPENALSIPNKKHTPASRIDTDTNRTRQNKTRTDFGLFRGAMSKPENALSIPNKNTLPLAGQIRTRTEHDKTKLGLILDSFAGRCQSQKMHFQYRTKTHSR